MSSITYIGCFFEWQDLNDGLHSYRRTPLFRAITHPHVTFAYKPTNVMRSCFGMPVTVRVIGYACDGENESLLVEFVQLPEPLTALAETIAVPHVTLSVSQDGEPVNSRYLTYQPSEPFLLTGVFGGMDHQHCLHLSP